MRATPPLVLFGAKVNDWPANKLVLVVEYLMLDRCVLLGDTDQLKDRLKDEIKTYAKEAADA